MISLTCGIPACAGTPHPAAPVAAAPEAMPAAQAGHAAPAMPAAPDPDLHRPPPRRLLDIDWASTQVASDADALALWQRIAPTGADWDDKLEEIPAQLARPLALAVLRGGNFACGKPAVGACGKPRYDVDPPATTAGFDDPCLRRLLALWAITQLEDADAAAVQPALLGIAALPPPESQLVAAAIHAVPEADHDARLALLAAAWRAGQRDLVESAIGALDEAHLVLAARKHHIASALEVLAAADHRAIYLAAIADDAMPARARVSAIGELIAQDDKLAPDLRAALVSAVATRDCQVAATAARALDQHGDHRFVPRRPRTASTAAAMRALCVLASYEALQQSDEPSLLASYLPARGLERITIAYDPLSDTDTDGDGDPHTTRTADLVPRAEAVLPEIEDLARAMQHCTGTICISDDHEFRFVWKPSDGELLLTRVEMADRLPCPDPQPAP
ncbi:MAG TPA: hypothetical protein VFT22_12195 [Kofleriaceae bacterium]|nr:hypothetical protein [Kofleriaceae bacterium]